MTRASGGDIVTLALAGVSQGPKPWRGGSGVMICDNFVAYNLEMQTPSGAWVPVADWNQSNLSPVAGNGMSNFDLPACMVRVSAASGALNVWLMGV